MHQLFGGFNDLLDIALGFDNCLITLSMQAQIFIDIVCWILLRLFQKLISNYYMCYCLFFILKVIILVINRTRIPLKKIRKFCSPLKSKFLPIYFIVRKSFMGIFRISNKVSAFNFDLKGV